MKKLVCALTGLLLAGVAGAKLPPLSDEAKAKADEAKAKTAWSEKVAAYRLCLVQDKVAATYLKAKAADAKPALPTAPCQEPGPYVEPGAIAAAPAAVVPSAPPSDATSTPKK